jgi:hypothetical protein
MFWSIFLNKKLILVKPAIIHDKLPLSKQNVLFFIFHFKPTFFYNMWPIYILFCDLKAAKMFTNIINLHKRCILISNASLFLASCNFRCKKINNKLRLLLLFVCLFAFVCMCVCVCVCAFVCFCCAPFTKLLQFQAVIWVVCVCTFVIQKLVLSIFESNCTNVVLSEWKHVKSVLSCQHFCLRFIQRSAKRWMNLFIDDDR